MTKVAATLRFGLVLSVTAAFLATPALAAPVQIDESGLRVRTEQIGSTSLRLDVWPSPGQTIGNLQATLGDISLPNSGMVSFPLAGGSTAVLLLVDTSDPKGRRIDVRRIVRHIGVLLKQAGEHHRFGLARFSGKLEMLAQLGTDVAKLQQGVRRLKAEGVTTELFRNVAAAVEQVKRADAARRAVIVFSDGQHEDPAFSHTDVVTAARAAGVAVFTIGYSRARGGSRWFQNLERMSKGTGGLYLAADNKLNLPKNFAADIFAALDAGGRTEIDLSPATTGGVGGAQTVALTVAVGDGASVRVPLAVTLPKVTIAASLSDPGKRLYVIGAGVIGLAFVAIVATIVIRRVRRASVLRAAEAMAQVPYAFLEFFDDTESRHPVYDKALRLGRNPDNDILITNTSVSAYHAEIQRRRDGTFIVTDLDSLNGVVVNNDAVDVGRLSDGDVIDLGEVRFRFRLNDERPAEGEETADVDDV